MSGYYGPRAWMSGDAAWNSSPNIAPYPSRTQGINPVNPQGQTAFGVDDAIAIAGILASIGGTIYSNHQQNKRQKEYMEQQQKYAKENWEMENNYNLPENVKSRLMAAGLNPNLMYGQGAASGQGGTINPAASPEAYFANPMDGVPSMISTMQQMRLTDSQIAVNESVAKRNLADASKSGADVDIAYKTLSIKQKELAETILRNIHLNSKDDAQAYNLMTDAFVSMNELPHQINLMDAQAQELACKTALEKAQSETWRAEAQARINLALSQINLNKKQIDKLDTDIVDIIATRSYRIYNMIASSNEMDKRSQLLQGEFDAMAFDIMNSLYSVAAFSDSKFANGVFAFRWAVNDILGVIGQAFGVNVGLGWYHHTGFSQTQQIPASQTPHNPIGFRHGGS